MKYIAFLRAINVGGRRLKMDVLRDIFSGINGLSQIETFIASGNVIFESAISPKTLEPQIEAILGEKLGYKVETLIRSTDEITKIAQYIPFAHYNPESDSLYIGFLPTTPTDEALTKLQKLTTEIDEFHVHERELYWLCHKSISESKISNTKLEKSLGMPSTLRDISTIKRLSSKYA